MNYIQLVRIIKREFSRKCKKHISPNTIHIQKTKSQKLRFIFPNTEKPRKENVIQRFI